MEFLDEALYVVKPTILVDELQRENSRVERLLRRALELETSAAGSVSDRFELEPTRSVLHRGAASLALRVGELATARRHISAALQGNPPADIRRELDDIGSQILIRASLIKTSGNPFRLRTPTGLTLVKATINRFTERVPVDIRGMLTALGVSLDIERFAKPFHFARGLIERNLRTGGFSGYRAAVNELYPREDQRVAAAHELSHFLKDRNRFTDRLVDNRMYSSRLDTRVEEEADKIALDWLVPGKQLAKIRQEVGYDNAEALASVFRIPVYEMKMRIGQIPRRHRRSEI